MMCRRIVERGDVPLQRRWGSRNKLQRCLRVLVRCTAVVMVRSSATTMRAIKPGAFGWMSELAAERKDVCVRAPGGVIGADGRHAVINCAAKFTPTRRYARGRVLHTVGKSSRGGQYHRLL